MDIISNLSSLSKNSRQLGIDIVRLSFFFCLYNPVLDRVKTWSQVYTWLLFESAQSQSLCAGTNTHVLLEDSASPAAVVEAPVFKRQSFSWQQRQGPADHIHTFLLTPENGWQVLPCLA